MKREDQQPEVRQGPDETFEPYEEPRRIPLPIYWIAIALTLWGTLMLYGNKQAVQLGREQRAENLVARPSRVSETGAALFNARCATCHQANGSGIRNAVPPLDASPFVTSRPEVIVQILLHGMQGPVEVDGRVYNGNMPDFSSVMSDEEIAQLVSFVRSAWSNKAAPVSPELVARERRRFSDLNRSWSGGEELLKATQVTDLPQPQMPPSQNRNVEPAILGLVREGRNDGSWACASCHGANGEGALNVPRLAGLNEAYIIKQLEDYLRGARQNEIMATVARTLSEQEMQGAARYYAGLTTASTAQPSLNGSIARGEELALTGDWSKNIPACFSCHGSSGFGVGGQFPSLAAQHPAYTVSQLNAWSGEHRKNSPLGMMESIAAKLSDRDRKAVADYFATLPPVPQVSAQARGD